MNINAKNAAMGSVLKIFSTDTDPVCKDISQNINFEVVLSIYSSMHKKAEESSIQYSRRVDAALCVRMFSLWKHVKMWTVPK